MSGIISTGNFPKALWPGVKKWYGMEYNEYPVQYDKLFDKLTSDKAWEEIVGTSTLGLAVQKSEGSPVTYDTERQGFTNRFQHVVYALGFIITQEMIEDDQYMLVGERRSKALARSMRYTKEVNGANIYNRAFNSSYTGGDGVSMINAAHPNVFGGTWSNQISTAADLSEASLEQAVIDIQSFTDDRGLLIATMPKALIIPRPLVFEAERILKADGRVGTDNNDPNALKTLGFVPEVVINQFLTDTDAWFIRTKEDGLHYFERKADTFSQDNDFDTENAKFKAIGRYSFGWSDPRAIYGSPGA